MLSVAGLMQESLIIALSTCWHNYQHDLAGNINRRAKSPRILARSFVGIDLNILLNIDIDPKTGYGLAIGLYQKIPGKVLIVARQSAQVSDIGAMNAFQW